MALLQRKANNQVNSVVIIWQPIEYLRKFKIIPFKAERRRHMAISHPFVVPVPRCESLFRTG
ncbi:hypothetical protein NX02_03670 [Sphingomonas sanxanigenens DSM 19645 = NX02]|uniref:Uncharacterized protein n=1 Tax=Sphingomonas sanxanigenens DSM 19645 = NX02 TaxID=1123269 RepID=W0A855_9SPHN|nr:hypothetical protein NX02_03670 [Sphingomonas sanxanigenens DSM 19645 = NX02]